MARYPKQRLVKFVEKEIGIETEMVWAGDEKKKQKRSRKPRIDVEEKRGRQKKKKKVFCVRDVKYRNKWIPGSRELSGKSG